MPSGETLGIGTCDERKCFIIITEVKLALRAFEVSVHWSLCTTIYVMVKVGGKVGSCSLFNRIAAVPQVTAGAD